MRKQKKQWVVHFTGGLHSVPMDKQTVYSLRLFNEKFRYAEKVSGFRKGRRIYPRKRRQSSSR